MANKQDDGSKRAKGVGDDVKKAKAAPKPSTTDKKIDIKPKKTEPKPTITVKALASKPASETPSIQPAAANVGVVAKATSLVHNENHALRKVLLKVAVVVLAVLVVVIIVFGVMIYAYKSENSVVEAVAQVIPYPVERVNGQFVSVNDYFFKVNANEKAYQYNAKLNNQTPVDFGSTAGKALLGKIKSSTMQQLESDVIVAQLAAQKHVVVTDAQVNSVISELYTRYGGKATLLRTLNQIYGWNLGDLQNVIRKQLLQQNLQTKITSDPSLQASAKNKAQTVLTQIQGGADFSATAKANSQSSDASSGGDLGYVVKGQLPDNEWTAAQALQPGSVSSVIQTQYGFEIIKVIDKKADGSIHIQHILIETIDFNQYLQSQISKAKVWVLLHD